MTIKFEDNVLIIGSNSLSGLPIRFAKDIIKIGGGSSPSWQDIVLSGNGSLTLTNAKQNGLNYVKLYGGCEQADTPTPTTPVDIVCNNGALKMVDSELPAGYKRVLGYTCNDNVLWRITDFKLRGSDTVRISFSITAACNVWGCYQGASATDNYDLYASVSAGSKYFRYGSGTYLSYFATTDLNKRFDVVYTPTGSTGMPQDSTWTALEFETANDLLIGSTTLTGTSAKLKGNLYGNFVVDGRLKLIPCERISDNVLGYYDTYSETFFEPTGTPTSLGYDGSHYVLNIDGTTETVKVTGKNLFDKDNRERIYAYFSATGSNWTYTATGYSNRIPCQPNTTYTARYNGNSTQAVLSFASTSSDDVPTSGVAISTPNSIRQSSPTIDTPITITTGASDKWLIVAYNVAEAQNTDMANNLQIEIGSTATTYEAYTSLGSATATDLLSVGDYKDVQSVLDGAVTRNVGIKVLDGTEDIYYLATNIIRVVLPDGLPQDSLDGLCTHYKFYKSSSTPASDKNFAIYKATYDGVARCIMGLRDSSITSVADFKTFVETQYANGTPVIVIYPLATATTSSVTGQTLTTQSGTNIIEITQASINNLPLEVSYKGTV